ncbi:MAG: metallophosphoesterase family protein [Pirellulales bacterium]|nr:metallophosphoesterase family protein [Pirellulales bacterium]
MKRAIISDVHGNLEALQAVLADIRGRGIDEIFCLGDTIGYGPNPCECLDIVIDTCQICLLGNHDQGALFDPEGFNTGAERAIFWTREQLESRGGKPDAVARRWDFLGELPRIHRDNIWLYVHGSPRNPINEYVFPEDIYNQKKMEKLFSLITKGCFQGHTHVPGVFTENLNFLAPEDIHDVYEIGDPKFMVNVGSVGQPRDGNNQSCYAVQEDNRVLFCRVEYDVGATADKIYRTLDLDDFLGDRLKEGR